MVWLILMASSSDVSRCLCFQMSHAVDCFSLRRNRRDNGFDIDSTALKRQLVNEYVTWRPALIVN